MDRPHRSARLHALKFNFVSLLHHLASSQHQTTHCLPDYRCKTKCERVPIPFLPAPIVCLSPSLPFPFPSYIVNQHSRHHAVVVRPSFTFSLFSITNNLLSSFLCFLCEYMYPRSLYTDIPATTTVRTTRVYMPTLLFVEEGMAL